MNWGGSLLAMRSPGKLLQAVLFVAAFLYAANKAANYVLADDMTGLAYVALLFIGSAFVVAMLNDWHKGLYSFLAWLLFEDFLGILFRLPTLAVSSQYATVPQLPQMCSQRIR